MSTLREQLKEAEARAAMLRQRIASAACAEAGHDWQSAGGTNAGCGPDCCCSVPVNFCARCEDCDYGQNAEADDVRAACARMAA